MNSTSTPTTENVNRLATIAMSVVYLLGGLFFGWNLLVIYAFSTMVDPALPDQQQHQEIVRRFLFGDGIHQIIFVIGLFAAALICFALSAMNVWSAVTGTRTKTKKSVISTGAITLSLIVFGIIYFAFS